MFNLSNFDGESKSKRKEKRRRLFHAKDFQSLMYPCFMFCRIIGIFPYKINASIIEISKPRYILSTAIICVCNIYALIALYGSSIFGKIDMNILPLTLGDDCLFGFGSFIMTITYVLCGSRMRLLQIILKISSRLPQESYKRLSRLIHAKDIIGSFILFGVMLIFAVNFNINHMFQMYIVLVIFQMDMLYMNCVCVLKACFKRIDDNLTHMREFMTTRDSNGCRLIYNEQRNPFLIMEIKTLQKEHLTISDTVQMLNMIFSLHLVATVILIFFDTTVTLYYYILKWYNINLIPNTFTKVLYHTYFVASMTFNFVKVTLIVWACETGKNQAQQISISIYDVFNSATDKQIKDELQLFSLQILHCNNIFSAKGFTMDAKLLAGIVGSIATYVLILLQFMRMSYSCEKKTTNDMIELIL